MTNIDAHVQYIGNAFTQLFLKENCLFLFVFFYCLRCLFRVLFFVYVFGLFYLLQAITLWTPDTNELKKSLSLPYPEEEIK